METTTSLAARFHPGRWPRRLAIGVVVSLVLFTIVGFFVIPPIARRVAQTQLGQALGRKVTIDRVRLNPFALSLAIEGFQIAPSVPPPC